MASAIMNQLADVPSVNGTLRFVWVVVTVIYSPVDTVLSGLPPALLLVTAEPDATDVNPDPGVFPPRFFPLTS